MNHEWTRMNTNKRIDATFTGEVKTDMEEVIYEGHEVIPK